ncbi:hypothetical protein FBU30_010567 [Linnemannia zychae]|nr:hypothetical protein FBU30_010567 [Linnemannia zychae]
MEYPEFRHDHRTPHIQIHGNHPAQANSPMDDITRHFSTAVAFKDGNSIVNFALDGNGERYETRSECLPGQPSGVFTTRSPLISTNATGQPYSHSRNISNGSINSDYIASPMRSYSPLLSEHANGSHIYATMPCEYNQSVDMLQYLFPPTSSISGRASPEPFAPGFRPSFHSPVFSPVPSEKFFPASSFPNQFPKGFGDGLREISCNHGFRREPSNGINIVDALKVLVELHGQTLLKLDQIQRTGEESSSRLDSIGREVQKILRGIDAIMVQNLELHEYPIPRLFVILPEKKSDGHGNKIFDLIAPRRLRHASFRLYFLCECSDEADCNGGRLRASVPDQIENMAPSNQIHLAEHEGYEISRPADFFQKYGSHVYKVLRVLQVIFFAASIVAPSAAHFATEMDKWARVAETISKNTYFAIKLSIKYLEENDKEGALLESLQDGGSNMEELANSLRSLDGAELRKLESFLRIEDKEMAFGNLTRSVTPRGHVKWLCEKHYSYAKHVPKMRSFIDTIESSGGIFNTYLCKITLTLGSFSITNDILNQLGQQGTTINELDLTLQWTFIPEELMSIKTSISNSNVRILKLDLMDRNNRDKSATIMERYSPVVGFFKNKNIQSLSLQGFRAFGSRIGDIHTTHNFSNLRRYHHLNGIGANDICKITAILLYCPNLVDLRLGSEQASLFNSDLCKAIGSLTKLEIFHIWNFKDQVREEKHVRGLLSCIAESTQSLTELVIINTAIEYNELHEVVRKFSMILEVLVLDRVCSEFDLTRIFSKDDDPSRPIIMPKSIPASKPADNKKSTKKAIQNEPTDLYPFSNLRQLHLTSKLSSDSISLLARYVQKMPLTHLGLTKKDLPMDEIIRNVEFSSIRSVYFNRFTGKELIDMWKSLPEIGYKGRSKIESISLERFRSPGTSMAFICLSKIAITRLWIGCVNAEFLKRLFESLNLKMLRVLAIVNCEYNWDVEAVLVGRDKDFASGLKVYLARNVESSYQNDVSDAYRTDMRDENSYSRLHPNRIQVIPNVNDVTLRYKLMVN